jgi:hypothetical protein
MVLDETVASVSSEVPKQLLNDAKRQTSSAWRTKCLNKL